MLFYKNLELKLPALLLFGIFIVFGPKNSKLFFMNILRTDTDFKQESARRRGVICKTSRAKGQSIVNCFYVYLWEHYAEGDTALACKMVILATPKHNLNRTTPAYSSMR